MARGKQKAEADRKEKTKRGSGSYECDERSEAHAVTK
jgi:stalled ribosome alternative rescue factor ArfA